MKTSILTNLEGKQKEQVDAITTLHELATLAMLTLIERDHTSPAKEIGQALATLPTECSDAPLDSSTLQLLAWSRTPAALIIALIDHLQRSKQIQAAAAISNRACRLVLNTESPRSELIVLLAKANECATENGDTEQAVYFQRKLDKVGDCA